MYFLESYQRNIRKTQFLSKIASFLIAVILLVEVFSNLNDLFFSEPKWTEAYYSFLKIIVSQAVVGIFFAFRLVLLFLNRPETIWYSLFIWLVCWLSVFAFFAFNFGFPLEDYTSTVHLHYQLSIYKSLLAIIPYLYLFLSPIKQIITLIFAYFYRK